MAAVLQKHPWHLHVPVCLEDFAAEMEEVCMSILLKELAEKAGVGVLWCFFCLCFMKEARPRAWL